MSDSSLDRDSKLRPALFQWNEPVRAARLREWLDERRLEIPDDLEEFWRRTGGGTIFESEVMFGPFGNESLSEDVDTVNEHHRTLGLPVGYLLVHEGAWITALRLRDKKWVVLSQADYSEQEEYESLDEWYRCVPRREFAERYGLPVDV